MDSPEQEPDLPALTDLRMVVTDMDGTLLHPDKSVPDGLGDVIAGLAEAGVEFVPASGRQLASLRGSFAEFPEVRTFIAENGAIAWTDGGVAGSDPMDAATARQVVRDARALADEGVDVGVVLAHGDTAYVERVDDAFRATIAPYYPASTEVSDLLAVEGDPLKVAVHSDGPIEPVYERVMARYADSHAAVLSGAHWCDLMARGVDKGTALGVLQTAGGFGPAQTMVLGDHLNDLGLFRASDWGFAVANAHADVLAVARGVVPSNADDGVVRTLRRVLGE